MRAWLEAAAARHPRRIQRIAGLVIAAVALAIAWSFAVTVLRHTRSMALPLDDSYGYLHHARQLARGQLRAALGDDAGGALWPALLAPLWLVGARGHALVWASFVVSAALYAATVLGVARVVRVIAGGLAGWIAAGLLLGVAAFASSMLAGSEAALASTLLVAVVALLVDAPPTGPPARALAACLAGASLAGREAAILMIAIAGVAAIQRVRQRDLRAAAWWLAPLAAPVLACCVRRVVTGHWLRDPDLAVLDATLAESCGWTRIARTLGAVGWEATSPLVWPRVLVVLWLVGAARVIAWARAARRGLAGAVIIAAPIVVMLGAAWSGRGAADHGRFLAPAVPFVLIGAGGGLGVVRGVLGGVLGGRLRAAATVVPVVGLAGFAWFAIPGLVGDARQFAQAAADLDAGVIAAAAYVHRKLPDAIVMTDAPGVVAYVAEVTTTALPASQGPGALFEQLERDPVDARATSFVVDSAGPAGAAAPAIAELSGDSVFRAALRPSFAPRTRAAGAEVLSARWDHVGTGERPLNDHAGWAIVDRIDVADRASEAAHGWAGALGPVRAGDAPARWSMLGREVGVHGLILDGGRTIRGGGERFAIAIDPARPARLVLRTGGARAMPGHDPPGSSIERAVPLRVVDDAGRELARATLPAPEGRFAEVTFALPAGAPRVLHTEASSAYRAFHWFVLQPE